MSVAQKIVHLCDPHLTEHDVEIPGELYRLGVQVPGGSWVWVEIDLCADDAAELAQLSGWLDKYGRVYGGPEKAAKGSKAKRRADPPAASSEPVEGGVTCPVCGFVSVNRSALGVHVSTRHETTLGQLEGLPTPFQCDECGRVFTRKQGLGVHMARTHKAEPTP